MFLKTKVFLCALAFALATPVAHAFDVTDTEGVRHRLAEYRGRWVVVNFWATWCAPCIKEIPEIAQFQRDHAADRAVVIGVALDVEDVEKTRQFARKVGHTYPLVLGDEGTEKQFGKVKGLPTTVIFDPAGKRVWDRTGTVTRKSLEDVIAAHRRAAVGGFDRKGGDFEVMPLERAVTTVEGIGEARVASRSEEAASTP